MWMTYFVGSSLSGLSVCSYSWLLLWCSQSSLWTTLTHLASGPWLCSCSAGTGRKQQLKGPCQPLLLLSASQAFLSVSCVRKNLEQRVLLCWRLKDVSVWSGNTAGCTEKRLWLVRLSVKEIKWAARSSVCLWFQHQQKRPFIKANTQEENIPTTKRGRFLVHGTWLWYERWSGLVVWSKNRMGTVLCDDILALIVGSVRGIYFSL